MASRSVTSPPRPRSPRTTPLCACSGRGRRCARGWCAGAGPAPNAAVWTVRVASREPPAARTRPEAREDGSAAPHAGPVGALLRLRAGAAAGALAALHAGTAGATAAGLRGSATTGLLLATAVVLGRHGASPLEVQQAPLPTVTTCRRSRGPGITPGRQRQSGPAVARSRLQPRRAGSRTLGDHCGHFRSSMRRHRRPPER